MDYTESTKKLNTCKPDEEITTYLEKLKQRFKLIDPNKYYLAYSGGKDSHFLYWFIKEYLKEPNITVVAYNTYMEHPQILARMNKYADVVTTPLMKPKDIKEKYGSPIFSKYQDGIIEQYQNGLRNPSIMAAVMGEDRTSWFNINDKAREALLSGKLHKATIHCCTYLKKKPGMEYTKKTGRLAIMGVRGSGEGLMRQFRYTKPFTKDGRFTPIFDLSEELEMKIYQHFNIELPEIYDHVDRTGCMGCPYGFRAGAIEKQLELLPEKRRQFVIEYFKETYDLLGVEYYLPLEDETKPKEEQKGSENK